MSLLDVVIYLSGGVMRDPERIKEILNIIDRIWQKDPDFRLMQILLNVIPNCNGKDSAFFYYFEDDELLEYLQKFNSQYKGPVNPGKKINIDQIVEEICQKYPAEIKKKEEKSK